MIKKIISGGQRGADQAALDAAIQWKIPHGGWISKGMLTEAGKLHGKYKLTEMPAGSHTRTRVQNVIDSDGALIVSHGPLTGISKYTKEKAEEHNRPCLHIDLEKISVIEASRAVKNWASDSKVETLNVTGPGLDEDKYIYTATKQILATLFRMERFAGGINADPILPETIKGVIELLSDELPLREKVQIARMAEDDLINIHATLGSKIRDRYLWDGNVPLIMDCIHRSGKEAMDEDEASRMIIYALWAHLKKIHRLRVVDNRTP